MALPVARLTKLQAVNDLLWTIGEAPVSLLDGSFSEASLAERVLDNTVREVLAAGWHLNTRRAVTLSTDVNDYFNVGVNILKIDTVKSDKAVDAVLRRKSDDSGFILYDVDNDSETWPDRSELIVDQLELMKFEDLTPSLQFYVAKKAGREFQKGSMASRVLHEIHFDDEQDALLIALQEDLDNSDANMIHDNLHGSSAVWRRSPYAGA